MAMNENVYTHTEERYRMKARLAVRVEVQVISGLAGEMYG